MPTLTPAAAGGGNTGERSAKPLTLGVIGDVPYGVDQEPLFQSVVDAINLDPKVRIAVHLGDIKNGSTPCTDERYANIAGAFAAFKDPLVYTPGDNEWADCHRVAAGSYNPLERLATIRSVFFPEPGSVLGKHPMRVDYQPSLIENVRWVESRVVFAALHIVGSNNGLDPWTGFTSPTPEQLAEVNARIAADLEWIDAAFDAAEAKGLPGVVLLTQSDLWELPVPGPGYDAIVDRIVERTAQFEGQVLVVEGDTHVFQANNPVGLDNFSRIVVHGETLPFEYLRLTINPKADQLFSWARVQVPTS